MTDEELKNKVAELSKWKSTFTGYEPNEGGRSMHAVWTEMPDYPHNLNAMHEAELELGTAYLSYCYILASVVRGCNPADIGKADDRILADCTFANAKERAEAFVKTMSKAT